MKATVDSPKCSLVSFYLGSLPEVARNEIQFFYKKNCFWKYSAFQEIMKGMGGKLFAQLLGNFFCRRREAVGEGLV